MWHGWRVDWGEEKPQARLEWPLLKRVFSYFLPYWRQGLVVLAAIGVSSAIDLIPAGFTKTLIDTLTNHAAVPSVFHGNTFEFVFVLVVIFALAAPASGLIRVGQSYFSNVISQGIMFDLRNQLFGRMLHQTVSFFTRTRTGDVMSRLSNDVNGIQSVVSDTIFSLVQNLVILITTVALMAILDWKLTLVALAVLPAFVLPTRRVGNATFEARKRTQSKLSEITAYMQEVLGISGILLVKAFVKQEIEGRRFRKLNGELRDLNVRQAMIGRWFFMLMGTLSTVGPAVLWLYGAWLVVNHEASLGTVAAFATTLLGRLYGPVSSLANLQVNVIGSLALFQRLFEYLDMPIDIRDRKDAAALADIDGAVAFDHVTFSYGAGRIALDDVSFAIEPGQLVALVGPSGAGKTTVTNLIARFYDPQDGSVLVDGHDVRQVTLESLGRQMGMVFQDTFLFHASVRDNLLYARPDATQGEVVVAAKAANIHDFIESLPEGYDTLVGERGHRLSGGEKQRIAIARVILKDPRILILDEATSNLDSESERLIQAALRPLFAQRTSFVIAHRLSTILQADVILVFDRGHLVEKGTHFELLQRGGVYARLYRTQFEPEAKEAQLV